MLIKYPVDDPTDPSTPIQLVGDQIETGPLVGGLVPTFKIMIETDDGDVPVGPTNPLPIHDPDLPIPAAPVGMDPSADAGKVVTVEDDGTLGLELVVGGRLGFTVIDHTGGSYPLSVDLTGLTNGAGTGAPATVLIGVPDGTGGTLTLAPGSASASKPIRVIVGTPSDTLPTIAVTGVTAPIVTTNAGPITIDLAPSGESAFGGDDWTADYSFQGRGLLGDKKSDAAALDGIEGYLDLNRDVADYVYSGDFDIDAWVAGTIGALPVGRSGHQFVDGDGVGVLGLTDGNWFGVTDATTLTFDNNVAHTGPGNTNPLTGGGVLTVDASGATLKFRSTGRAFADDPFGQTTSTGTWRIPQRTTTGTGAPADTLGEDGDVYYDLGGAPTPDVYLKAAGSWSAIGSLAVAI